MNTNATTTDIAVVTPESAVSLASALHLGDTFMSEATLTGDSYAPRRATWLTGNSNMFAANGKTPLESARGFFIDQPDEGEMFPEDYELMDAMEALCEQGKARAVQVEHLDENRKPHKVLSWQFMPTASLFVVCQGVPSKQDMQTDATVRWGIAYAGYRTNARGETQTSELHFIAFIQELMDAGYHGSFAFKFSKYTVDKALACLRAQEYVLRFINALRADANELQALPYYACALPILCSTNTVTAGTEAGKTKQVYYPVPGIPRLSRNNPTEALAYLARVAITRDQVQVLEYDGRVETTVEWSKKKSQRIIAGNDTDDVQPIVPPSDDTPPLTDADAPF